MQGCEFPRGRGVSHSPMDPLSAAVGPCGADGFSVMGMGWCCFDLLVPNLASQLLSSPYLCPLFDAIQVCIWWPSLPSPDCRGQGSALGGGEGGTGAERQGLSEFCFSLDCLWDSHVAQW